MIDFEKNCKAERKMFVSFEEIFKNRFFRPMTYDEVIKELKIPQKPQTIIFDEFLSAPLEHSERKEK